MSMIGFQMDKCKDCYKCVRICPVKAIKIRNEHTVFEAGQCIECGACLASCPQDAIVFTGSAEKVKKMVASGEKTVVSLAPAYLGVFGDADPNQMAAALKQLGFTYVHETAEAAYYVCQEYMKCSDERGDDSVVLLTNCSAVNNLMEKYHPDMLQYTTPVVTPAIAHARMLRAQYGPDVKIVYISPCVSDGDDCLLDKRTRGVVDAVLDFESLRDWLRGEGMLIPQIVPHGKKDALDSLDPKVMRLFAVSGGVLSSIKADKKHVCTHKRLYISGVSSCEELFDCIRNGEISNCVIELNACIGGCINGPMKGGKVSDRFKAKISVSQKVDEHEVPDFPELDPPVDLSKTYVERYKRFDTPTEQQLKAILSNLGIETEEDEKNCGACGFPTCKAKATAVFQGRSGLGMCMPHMYEQAKNISDVILSATPNIIMVIDENMNVCEYNAAAERTFGVSKDDAMGRPISDFIPDDYVRRVYDYEIQLFDQRIDYKQYNICTMQNIIYIPEQRKVLILMRNITEAVRRQEKHQKAKMDSVVMAQNVINKQMMVAQEIAGLLGETTAETKSTLRKLRDTLMTGEEEL